MASDKEIIVVHIETPGRIVINKGHKDNINYTMRFLVYKAGKEIIDPTTKKSLGILEMPKGTFRVAHIMENMTLLQSEISRPSPITEVMKGLTYEMTEWDLVNSIVVGDTVKVINED